MSRDYYLFVNVYERNTILKYFDHVSRTKVFVVYKLKWTMINNDD